MQISQRNLPHFYQIGHPIFVTFRLQGSLPPGREFPDDSNTAGKSFVYMDRLLDSNRDSPRYLQIPGVAECVADEIQDGGKSNFELHAWVIMPNHVHILITPQVDVSQLMRKLKGSTARQANLLLGRTGVPFWQRESFDRLVRDSREFYRIESYIVQNPVRAGLVREAEEYRWSSAWSRLQPAVGFSPLGIKESG